MDKYAILCGDAEEGFSQKKINEMHDFLVSEAGGLWSENEIMIFPNGTSEKVIIFSLEQIFSEKKAGQTQILLYICTSYPSKEKDDSLWLGGYEIHKSVIEKLSSFPKDSGMNLQVIYDWDRETVRNELFSGVKAF